MSNSVCTAYVEGFTKDDQGNSRRWQMSGKPAFCDDTMTRRRLVRRHEVMFGVTPSELVSFFWTGCPCSSRGDR